MALWIDGRAIRRFAVLGFGVTGRAVVEHLLRRRLDLRVSEAGRLTDGDRRSLERRRISYEEEGHTEAFLQGAEAVVLSPGVACDHPALLAARDHGIRVVSEIDLVTLAAPRRRVIAVTGTNGKGSTVRLIEAMLASVGIAVDVGGNIGTPAVSLLESPDDKPLVLEVSSFQLEQSDYFHPHIAVLLNLTPDHLERHRTMERYAAAKARLFRLQTAEDVAVLPSDLEERFRLGRARRVFYDLDAQDVGAVFPDLPPHQHQNVNAAAAASRAFAGQFTGIEGIHDALRTALRVPHRMDPIGFVDGIRVVDDSKSTNAASTIAALRAAAPPVVLLLGGRWKREGYDLLLPELEGRAVRAVVLYGEARVQLRRVLAPSTVPIYETEDLREAVEVGLSLAQSGDTLLFSPGCASYDAYGNCLARGDAFTRLIESRRGFRSS